MTPATSETGPFVGDELRLRSVDLILGPATDLHSLFSALAAAADEAELVPHTVHCDRGRDGFRLVATCEVDSSEMTMEGIVRILRRDPYSDTAPCPVTEAVA